MRGHARYNMELSELKPHSPDYNILPKVVPPSELYAVFMSSDKLLHTKSINYKQGLNAIEGFDVQFAAEVAKLTGFPFQTAPNKVLSIWNIALNQLKLSSAPY